MPRRLALLPLGILLTMALAAAPPSGGDYEIIKSTIDNGGGASSGGDYVLRGSIGQPDASSSVSGGGDFQAAGGFWATVSEFLGELIFKDGFE